MNFKGEEMNIISCNSNQLFLFPLHERHAQTGHGATVRETIDFQLS